MYISARVKETQDLRSWNIDPKFFFLFFTSQVHGKKILKLLQKIFSWLPLATVINQKVLILHGGISDTTDLQIVAKLERHRVSR